MIKFSKVKKSFLEEIVRVIVEVDLRPWKFFLVVILTDERQVYLEPWIRKCVFTRVTSCKNWRQFDDFFVESNFEVDALNAFFCQTNCGLVKVKIWWTKFVSPGKYLSGKQQQKTFSTKWNSCKILRFISLHKDWISFS